MFPLVTASETGEAHPESEGACFPEELWGLDRIYWGYLLAKCPGKEYLRG